MVENVYLIQKNGEGNLISAFTIENIPIIGSKLDDEGIVFKVIENGEYRLKLNDILHKKVKVRKDKGNYEIKNILLRSNGYRINNRHVNYPIKGTLVYLK